MKRGDYLSKDNSPLNSMLGTITFSQMPVSVLVSANSCLYAGRSATEARNWIALLTSCTKSTLSSLATYYYPVFTTSSKHPWLQDLKG